MGISVLPYRYRINGVLNTGDTVLANMERLANSCSSWISYDMFTGLWDVVINGPADAVQAFDDSNIIGSINLSGTGLREMYNSVEVQFPHSDLNNQMDYIRISIPPEERLPNEPDNTLNISYDLLHDPVQAMFLGLVELKQARMNHIITFTSDYSMVGLGAGNVISVTNAVFGFSTRLFRIVSIREIASEGGLVSEITALEYDPSIYDTSDLHRYIRTNAAGIVSIGAIGIPAAPEISKFEQASRPRILIEAVVPSGLVSGMEYWITTDVGAGSDENRLYRRVGTVYSSTGPGQLLTSGSTVEFEYDNIGNSDFLVKVRGVNGSTTGPFSTPSAAIEFRPVQTTDAVGSTTQTLDDAGSAIPGLLSANALLYLLGQLMNGDTSAGTPGVGSGSLWTVFWELFNTTTGQPAGTTVEDTVGGIGNAARAGGKMQISASSGLVTVADLEPTTTGSAVITEVTFVCAVSGQYKIDVIIDQNSSGAAGGRGADWSEPEDFVQVGFGLFQGIGTSGTQLVASASGGPGAQYWTDFSLTGLANLTAGTSYTIQFVYQLSTESNPTATASFDVSWNIYTLEIG